MYDPKCSTTFPWCTINAPAAFAWCTINVPAAFARCTNRFVHKVEFSYIGWNGVHPLWCMLAPVPAEYSPHCKLNKFTAVVIELQNNRKQCWWNCFSSIFISAKFKHVFFRVSVWFSDWFKIFGPDDVIQNGWRDLVISTALTPRLFRSLRGQLRVISSLIPPLHRGCDLCASLVRPQNWPGRRWRHKGGRTVALVVQGWYTGRSDIAMVAMKFWACSKQSPKGRRGGRSLTGRSKEAGGRHTLRRGRRMDAQWSAIGRPVKNAYCCEHCVSIWATLLPSVYHHWASFGRPIAPIERSLWRPRCLHWTTTATFEPHWQWICLHCAVPPLCDLLSHYSRFGRSRKAQGSCCSSYTALLNRTFWIWATTERPNHFCGRSKVARRSQPCVNMVKGA